ncbi:hypothetical protein C0Q70_07757 [Pomacea canaliculata]|uniref:Uncharacterized protein n=2 Tax=Pomacea canaliculata TaxID=400727 RepID=A0A2T7PFX7_POMCA|nr:hypothetical protein C0Q70_07757 [Pomacea canaliculata]
MVLLFAGLQLLLVSQWRPGTSSALAYSLFCSPKLWEGRLWTLQMKQTDEGTDVWESVADISVDVIGQRLASRETGSRFGQEYNTSYLYYFPARTLYVITDGRCQAYGLEGNVTVKCVDIPDQYIVEYLKEYMGDDYTNGVFASGMRDIRDGVGHFYSVDPEGNIPLLEETHGVIDEIPTYTVTNYYNITLGIKDPTVFTPPEICLQSPVQRLGKGDEIPVASLILLSV